MCKISHSRKVRYLSDVLTLYVALFKHKIRVKTSFLAKKLYSTFTHSNLIEFSVSTKLKMAQGMISPCDVLLIDDATSGKEIFEYSGTWWDASTEECPTKRLFKLDEPFRVDTLQGKRLDIEKGDLVDVGGVIMGWYSRKNLKYQRTVPRLGTLGTCDAKVVEDFNEKRKPSSQTYDGKWTTAEAYEGCPERYYFKLKYAIALPDEWHFEIEDHDLVYDDDEIKGWYSSTKGKYTACPEQKVNCVACVRHVPHCKEACGENGNCRVRSANFVCRRCGLDVCKKCYEIAGSACAECFGKHVEKPKLEGLFWKSFDFVEEEESTVQV